MKLTELDEELYATVKSIEGDRRYLSRITSIGINIGCKLKMIKNVPSRPLLVYCRDTTIALNRKESENIQVEVTNA